MSRRSGDCHSINEKKFPTCVVTSLFFFFFFLFGFFLDVDDFGIPVIEMRSHELI